jgi:hypothetical protein
VRWTVASCGPRPWTPPTWVQVCSTFHVKERMSRASSRSPSPPSSSTLEPRSRRQRDHISAEGSPTSTNSSNTPLRAALNRERSNVINSNHPLDHRSNIDTPKHADETVSNPLFPPLPTHYSFATAQFYRFLSMILSVGFLVFVLVCAMLKTLPSIGWVIWSWCQFKDPNRLRPFYQREKERRHLKTGKLKCDVGYYAQCAGLECDETKIETEDGFILTIQHIVDRRQGAVDSKSMIFNNLTNNRKISSIIITRIIAVIGNILCQ